MKIIKLEETASTNEYCKTLDYDEVVVSALRQTAGKGTKGRSFQSDEGGIYLSYMRRLNGFPAENAFKIMINSCTAVCRTLELFGIPSSIRWANDVLVGGKKICGTLIENTFSGGYITRSIVGCGINVNNSFSGELGNIAISMKEYAGKFFDKEKVEREFIKKQKKDYSIDDYKSYMDWLGSVVTLKIQEKEISVKAVDVASDGRLIVESGGKLLKISSAEVSLRL